MRKIMFAAIVLLTPTIAAAQGATPPTGLAGLLPGLILREVTLPSATHAAHFSPLSTNDQTNPAVEVVESFNKQLVVQLSTAPVGSSTGGFTYTFDPAVGTFRRASRSFGPTFAERALTVGRGRFNAGISFQHLSYASFENRQLDDGSIQFYLRHGECCTTVGPPEPPTFGILNQPNGTRLNPFFEGDLVRTSVSLQAVSDATVFFGNYGVNDRLDVGLAIPLVKVKLDATLNPSLLRLATGSLPIHSFDAADPNATERTFAASGSATGLGDVVVRAKYRLAGDAAGALAVAVDVRLPTGDENNLLGAGAQAKLFMIASSGNDRWGQHANVGYTFASGELNTIGALVVTSSSYPNEFNYAGGVEFVAESRVTLIGDIVGRVLLDTGRLRPELKSFQFVQGDGLPVMTAQFEEFAADSGSIHLAFGTVGIKYNPLGSVLLNANVIVPMTKAGLRSRVGFVVGLDYGF
jgi:hypothetical protein